MLGAVNVRLITRNTSYMQPFFFKAQHRARNYDSVLYSVLQFKKFFLRSKSLSVRRSLDSPKDLL